MTRLRTVLQGEYVYRAVVVALIVGSGLNLINQPEAIFGEAQFVWWKLILTYLVPYFVATYGAYGALPLDD